MALKQEFEITSHEGEPTGVVLEEAYHRVYNVALDPLNEQAAFTVRVYKSEQEAENPNSFIGVRQFTVRNGPAEESPVGQARAYERWFEGLVSGEALEGPETVLEACYTWLKKHPMYSESEDC